MLSGVDGDVTALQEFSSMMQEAWEELIFKVMKCGRRQGNVRRVGFCFVRVLFQNIHFKIYHARRWNHQ